MGLTDDLRALLGLPKRDLPLPWDQYVSQYATWFKFGNNIYNTTGNNQTYPQQRQEDIGDYAGIISHAYKGNGVVFACMLARMLLFSEARFQFQALRKGRPGELFGTDALGLLEVPGPNQATGDFLSRMIQDVDLYGNWFGVRRARRIKRLNPEWVTIVMGSQRDADMTSVDIDAEVIGYIYYPGGRYSGNDPEALLPESVAHWAPIPDPSASFRGMSWITPVVREIMGDSAARDHKLAFFENAATPNMVVSLDANIELQAFKDWVEQMEDKDPRGWDSYRTMYMGAGAQVQVVGADLKQLDFKIVQGAGETRIAAAAGVPPIIVGLSEGLQAATYSNYGQARRRFADGTMRPLWRSAASALQSIMEVPSGSRLWYDDRDIPFLQEDVKDAAEITQMNAGALRSLLDGGWEPDAAIEYVQSGDLARLLGRHSGLFSVQLQPPMPEGPPAPTDLGVLDKPDAKQIEAPRSDPPVLNIYNQFPEDFVRAGDVTVNMPEQATPVTNVTVEAQEPAQVNFAEGSIVARVEAPPPAEVTVNVAPAEASVVNIAEGALRVDAPPPAEVTVNIPEQDPPVVNVNLPEPRPLKRTVTRDDGRSYTVEDGDRDDHD